MQEIPKYVMRFYCNADYALECISLKQITFIHVAKLNDPFDPIVDCATNFNDDYASLLAYLEQYHYTQLALFKEKLPEQNWNEIVAGWAKSAREMLATMFVFSTCAVTEWNHPRDNLYMWGHYGNGHRGIAIEFNTTVLAESFEKQDVSGSDPIWWEMDYIKDIPRITCEDIFEFVMNVQPNKDNLESYGPKLTSVMLERFHSKSEIWKSEDEWRLALTNDNTKMKILRHDLPDNAITAIYLGCRVAEQEQARNDFVYEKQRNFPSATVFIAKVRKGEYALDFEKIA